MDQKIMRGGWENAMVVSRLIRKHKHKTTDEKYEVPWYIWFGFGMLVMFMLSIATQVIVRIGESF